MNEVDLEAEELSQPCTKYKIVENMHKSLSRFCNGKQTLCIPPQDTDDDMVIHEGTFALGEAISLLRNINGENFFEKGVFNDRAHEYYMDYKVHEEVTEFLKKYKVDAR